ncbi:MAG: ABC transporter permease [Defluviitaleaceae bacterium]|nr:ABC transporter permease [Defluviitaleaceae bacterium]
MTISKREAPSFLQVAQKTLSDFGLPRIIIMSTFILLLVLSWVNGMNVPSLFGDVLRRWGMFGILVLAMVPGIRCGIGPNFGVTVGITGGLLGAVLSVEMRYIGMFDFIAHNPTLFGLTGAFVAIIIGVSVATVMGILYGMLLNKVKGSEMAVSVYVGFSVVNLFNMVWFLIPLTASILLFPAGGQGLRLLFNLRDDFGGVLNNLGQFRIYFGEHNSMNVPTGLLVVFFICCICMWLFTKSRLGMMMTAAGSNPEYARASGINVEKMRILGTTISTALGALGIIVYAQSFGFIQLYNAPQWMGFLLVAAVLIGGASIRRARVFDVLLGTFMLQGILTIALPLINVMLPDVPALPEILRLIITNGIILYALSKAKGG